VAVGLAIVLGLVASGEGGDPGTSYPYTIGWRSVGSGAALSTETPRGQLRDLVLPAVEAGEHA
jgi:hypothetical protein